MKSSVEPLEGNKVRLSIEVDEEEFDRAVDAAVRKLARSVKVPGFRPGKVPRRIIESRLGTGFARQEALRESVPDFYSRALQEHDVDAVAAPEIDITSGRDEGPVAFDAVVEVMPQVRVGGYEGLRVVVPNLGVTEEEVDSQVERLRDQFGELQSVARQARGGDHVSMDRRVTRHDETLLVAEDELYEVGKGTIAPELDDQLRGARTGDILRFNATTADHGEATFQILVKDVREKKLPEVTDEWADEASEFATVAQLRDDIRRRTDAVKRLQVALQVRDKVIDALVELVTEDMPESLLDEEAQRRFRILEHRLTHQDADMDQYLQVTGKTRVDVLADMRTDAESAVKADLALRFVADAEGIEVTDADVDAEIIEMAQRQREPAETVRAHLDREDRIPAVRSGISKAKALEWLIDHTEYVDEDGRVVDRSELQPPGVEGSPEPEPTREQETTE